VVRAFDDAMKVFPSTSTSVTVSSSGVFRHEFISDSFNINTLLVGTGHPWTVKYDAFGGAQVGSDKIFSTG